MFTAGDVSAAATASNPALPSLWQMLIGQRQGSLGEVCALALLLGFAYLLIRRVITPVIPLTYIGTVAVIMLIAGLVTPLVLLVALWLMKPVLGAMALVVMPNCAHSSARIFVSRISPALLEE